MPRNYNDCCCGDRRRDTHDHEYCGNVKVTDYCRDPHNHRFCGISGPAIPVNGSHVHNLENNTDFYETHYHEMCDKTGPAISVGDGRHVHYLMGKTSQIDNHRHDYEGATLIENQAGYY